MIGRSFVLHVYGSFGRGGTSLACMGQNKLNWLMISLLLSIQKRQAHLQSANR